MFVVLAEKPSVARDIAAVLGATVRRDGYFEGNGYAVTYAIGHLVAIAEPEEIDPRWGKPWRLEQLPMIPDRWKYRVMDRTAGQFKTIKALFCDPKTQKIICATDAGREGEHIFRLIYQMAHASKPVERLWISSLTSDAIRDGFRKLRSSKDFDQLANAASARAHADWIVGLTFTRAYTTINNVLCTIGRVQTPTLALIVSRQEEIDNFKSEPFFEILVTFKPGFVAKYITDAKDPQTRLKDKVKAEAILQAVAPSRSGFVHSIENAQKKNNPPPLYDLLTLQKDANKRFGYTAQETLDLAQNLYEEHKLISYPRTESRFLSADMVADLPAVLLAVLKGPTVDQSVRNIFDRSGLSAANITADALRSRLTKAHIDDTRLTDHHAIIPTHKVAPSALPDKQRKIYDLICTRFLSMFLTPEIRDETILLIDITGHLFKATGVIIRDPGWTVLNKKAEADQKSDDSEAQQLPMLHKGQEIEKVKQELKESKTSPPKPYNDASLLTAMKHAGKELDDEDLANYMKQSGLGTPATRAAIIERLIQTNYIERSKKSLLPTQKGRALIASVHATLKDVALTATWEQQLSDIQDGKLPIDKFESAVADFVRNTLPLVVQGGRGVAAPPPAGSLGACPKCKQGAVRMSPKGAGCTRWREGCKFMIWREQYGKKLTDGQIESLLKDRQTKVIKGFKKKDGSGKYDAQLVLNDEFRVSLQFSRQPPRAAE